MARPSDFTFSTGGKIGLAALLLSSLLIPALTSWDFVFVEKPIGRDRIQFMGPVVLILPLTLLVMYLGTKYAKMQSGDALVLGFAISMLISLVIANVFHISIPWLLY